MPRSEYVAARVTPAQREKLKRLAAATGQTMSGILCELVDVAGVETRAYLIVNANRVAADSDGHRDAVAA